MTNPTSQKTYLQDDVARSDIENYRQEMADRLKFQVDFAQALLKNLTLVNGGAIVALFTFLGHDGNRFIIKLLWWSFTFFSIGLASALAAFIAAFYSQLFFMNATAFQMWNSQLQILGHSERHDQRPDYEKGDCALKVGVALAILSLVTFVIGAAFALGGVQ